MQMDLWRQVVDALESRIKGGELKPGDRLESEEVLAVHFGASRQTIHKAVQELKRRGLVERKRRWGTTIAEPPAESPSSSGLVALLFDYANDYPQGELMRGVSAGLGEGQRIVLADSHGEFQQEANRLEECRSGVEGILAYPMADAHNDDLYREVVDASRQGGPPLVFIDRILEGVEADSVVSDNLEASQNAINWAVSRGHRRIAFFSGDNTQVSTIKERHSGYRTACSGAGVYDVSLERWFPKSLEAYPDRLLVAAADALCSLLTHRDPITALFCTQDIYAVAVAEALGRIGSPPGELDLITYNDWPAPVFPKGAEFSRIVQPMHAIGRQAAELLGRRLADRSLPPQKLRLASEFFPVKPPSAPGTLINHETNEG